MNCPRCESQHLHKNGSRKGFQRYKCVNCGMNFLSNEVAESNNEYITHFNIKLKKTDRLLLTRENYCEPSNEIVGIQKKFIQDAKRKVQNHEELDPEFAALYYNIPNHIFSDEEHFTDSYISKHYEKCMRNFDLNMEYFESLDYESFNTCLLNFVKKHKFLQATDLAELKDISGIYIMVLDNYKQVYIGMSEDAKGIKSRIMNHWSRKKEFWTLVFGKEENSIIAIDSFGALDTTRIFYKEIKWYQGIFKEESKYISLFDSQYRLNRIV